MTSLEKQKQVKDVLHQMCTEQYNCFSCRFFVKKDRIDIHPCALLDDKGIAPDDENWNMNTALLCD